MNRIKLFIIYVLLLGTAACVSTEKVHNLVKIDPTDQPADIVRKATQVRPSQRQYAWQQQEFIAFLHFGPNTFTGVEWGTGLEDPVVFNPTDFDAGQWISVIKEAGMKMAMLTAKHHDGFCLWPTGTTEHSVASSPWKNGQGDVMGDLAKAAQEEDIAIGVYLSPADLNQIEAPGGTYGNGSAVRSVKIPTDPQLQKTARQVFEFELDDYNALFMNQLYEVLTQYGTIAEVWFDGANPKPGTGQTYNRKAWYELIRQLQPEAVIAIKGPDVRWCGNEAGHTRENEWSVLPVPEHPDNFDWPDLRREDLGSREQLAGSKYLYWYPAETNTSIRHGWFYRDEEQYVKTVEELLDTWYRSVGGNTVFLLNLTPDRRGRIPEKDAGRLREVGRLIAQSFRHNLAGKASLQASSGQASARHALDGQLETSWKPVDGEEQAELVLDLGDPQTFNRLVLQEDIRTHGQRVERFAFDIWTDDQWKEVTAGTVVGYKNIRRFPMVETNKVRLRILESRVAPTLSILGLYRAPEMLSNPLISRNKEGMVSIKCKTPDPKIYYTLDGSQPNAQSPLYQEPFSLPEAGTVKAVAITGSGANTSDVISARYDLCPAKWTVHAFSAEHRSYRSDLAIDGNPATMWHTPWGDNATPLPHHIEIDLGEHLDLKGVTYLPRQDRQQGGICKEYRIEISENGTTWQLAKTGKFDNIQNSPVLQEIRFGKVMSARYIRFTALENVQKQVTLSVAELGVITR